MKRSALLLVTTLGLTAGCMPVANYHSARTLGEGESAVGTTFSAVTYTDTDNNSVTLPGLIPEFTYHIGVTDDFEFGGRIAPGFAYGELDAKYRFLHSNGLHMALAPAVGQVLLLASITTVRLPVILTYELTPRFALNASVNATMWGVRGVDADDRSNDYFGTGGGFMTTTGVSLGVEVSGETAYIRPSIEISRAVLGDDGDTAAREEFQIGAVVFHFGMISGREMKKLDEMDRKLDEINGKLSWRHRVNPGAQAAAQ